MTVCVCGQTPPPVHGQAVMIRALLDGAYTRIRPVHVRMAFSREMHEVGRLSPGKLLHLPGLALRLAWARLRHGARVLYYPPAGPDRVPLWRDMLLLLFVRPLFPRVVYHFHIAGLAAQYRSLNALQRALFRLAYGRPDLAIYLSSHSPEDAAPLRPRAVRVIPNGLPEAPGDTPDPAPRPPAAAPVILFVGVLSPEKGLDTLLEACRLLRARGLAFHCRLVGEFRSAVYGQSFRERILAFGLEDHVRLAGRLTGGDKWGAYAGADVFCFPTRADAFGLVVLEAMLMRLPVVASDWCGLKDLVVEGETGFRAPRGDAPAFADRLERLLRDPALRRRLGEAGRARYERGYTLAVWRDRMEQALAECGGAA